MKDGGFQEGQDYQDGLAAVLVLSCISCNAGLNTQAACHGYHGRLAGDCAGKGAGPAAARTGTVAAGLGAGTEAAA